MDTYNTTDPEENAKLCGADLGKEDRRQGVFDTTLPHGISEKLRDVYLAAYLAAYLEANPPQD